MDEVSRRATWMPKIEPPWTCLAHCSILRCPALSTSPPSEAPIDGYRTVFRGQYPLYYNTEPSHILFSIRPVQVTETTKRFRRPQAGSGTAWVGLPLKSDVGTAGP